MSYQIFISYRRDGAEFLGQLLFYQLKERGYRVFFDVESLRSGKFNQRLFQVIDECTDVLVILPKDGLDRCMNSEDWVRKEIAYAIRKKKNIIPVMMRGFEFPDSLPDDIKEIVHYNGISASMDFFEAVMDRLTGQYIQAVPDLGNTKQPDEFDRLLQTIYEVLTEYRDAINNNRGEKINEITGRMQSSLNDLYVIGERNRYLDSEKSEKALSIVDQFNRFVGPFNAFSNSEDRMSDIAQGYARRAELEYRKLIDLVVRNLS